MKKKLAWLVLVLLVAGVLGTFLYVRSAYPPERLRALLEPRVEEALGRPVSIGGASWSVMPLAVRLDDVRVHTDARETATLFELQALRFDLRWIPLLRREIAVRSLVLESPRVILERTAEGRWNYETDVKRPPAAQGRAQTAATPVALRIESLRVQNGSLQLRDAMQDVQLVVPLEAELLLQTDRALRDVQLRGWIQSEALSGGDEGRLSAVRDVRVRFEPRLRADVADSTATVEGLRVEIEGLVLELEGRAALQNGAPVVHLRTRSEQFELAEILSLVPKSMAPDLEKITARGTGQLSLQIDQDPGAEPRVVGRLALTGGTIEHTEWPAPVRELNAELDWADGDLVITRVESRVADSPVHVNGRVTQALDPKAASYDLNLKANVDLARVAPMMTLPPDVTVQGRVDADVQVRGVLQPGALPEVRGPLTLTEVRVQSPELAQPLFVDATLQGTGDVLRIEKGTLRAGEDRIALGGDIAPALPPELPRLRLQGTTKRLDLDALLPAKKASVVGAEGNATTTTSKALLPPLPPAHLDVALQTDVLVAQQATFEKVRSELRADGKRFTVTLRGERFRRETTRLRNVEARLEGDAARATGELRAQDGMLGKLAVQSLRSDMTVEGTRIELPNLTGTAYEGAVQGRVVVDLTNPDAPQQNVDVGVEEVQLGGVLSDLWSAGGLVTGNVSGATQMLLQGADPDAIRRTLSAEGRGIAVNGRLREMPLLSQLSDWLQLPNLKNINYRELGFDFKVDAGRLRFPRLQIQSQDANFGVLGSAGLDGTLDLDLQVQLSEAMTRNALRGPLAGRTGKLFTDAQGHLVLDFDVIGTFRAPKLQPNFERTGARGGIRALGQQEIKRLLSGLSENLGAPTEDTLGKKLEEGVKDAKGALGGLLKKRTAPPDSTKPDSR